MSQDSVALGATDITVINHWWRQIHWGNLAWLLIFEAGAVCALFPQFFTWPAFFLFLAWQLPCGIAGNIGMHRLLTHRTYKTYKPIEYLLAWLGSLNWQGGPIWWVASHRLHHRLSDTDGDPHTPKDNFFWGFLGWMVVKDPRFASLDMYSKYAPDVAKDPVHRLIERGTIVSHLLVAGFCYLVAGWPGVFWGSCLRTIAILEVTGLVNSASHRWGYRTFNTDDDSTNLWWVAMLTYGEWHHNHHAYPNSARHGFYWWETDVSYNIIQLMGWLGLAWDIRVPPKTFLDTKGAVRHDLSASAEPDMVTTDAALVAIDPAAMTAEAAPTPAGALQ